MRGGASASPLILSPGSQRCYLHFVAEIAERCRLAGPAPDAFLQLLNLVDEGVYLSVGKQRRCAARVQQDDDVILGVVTGSDAVD